MMRWLILALILVWSLPAAAQECPGRHRATLNGYVCLTPAQEAARDAEEVAWHAALPDRKKVQARMEAIMRIRPRGRQLTASAAHIATVQLAFDTLFDEINAMTLADLEALNVGAWVGWPR